LLVRFYHCFPAILFGGILLPNSLCSAIASFSAMAELNDLSSSFVYLFTVID